MINSIDNIIMVGAFPRSEFSLNELDNMSKEKLMELAQTHNWGVWDVYDLEDLLNNDNLNTEDYWIKIMD